MPATSDSSHRPGVSSRPEAPRKPRAGAGHARVSWYRLALSSLVVSAVVCRLAPVLSPSEFRLLDHWLRWRPPRLPDDRIAIVGIEPQDIEAAQTHRDFACSCLAVSRADLARAITRLKQAGAMAIGLDLRLEVACPYKRGTPAGHDDQLARALNLPGETVLIAGALPTPERTFFSLPLVWFVGRPGKERLVASPEVDRQGDIRGVSLIQYGVPVRGNPDEPPSVERIGQQFAPLCVALLGVLRGQPDDLPSAVSPHAVVFAGQTIPVWPSRRLHLIELGRQDPAAGRHSMLINWVGPVGSFPTYALSSVLEADPKDLRERYGGKVVLLGSLAERFFTPMSGRSAQPRPGSVDQTAETSLSGTEIHANALNTLLTERYLVTVPRPLQVMLVFVLAFVAAYAFQTWSEKAALAFAGALLLALVVASYLLVCHDLWLPAAIPAVAFLGSAVVSAFWGFALVRQEAEELAAEVEVRDAATETVVHDLKQPLAAIGALTSVLRRRQERAAGPSQESLEMLEHIQQQVDRAIGDIDDLLAATPGREIGLVLQRFDLVALARETAEVQRLRSSYHDVEVEAPEQPVWVHADVRYMSRVLSNLVDNALKYWPEGGTVRVVVRRNPPWAEVSVIDHGLGISPEQKDRIFARFTRSVPAGANIPGSGIGLYSVHRIVDAHGGEVSVESEVGVGSTFVVRIPCADEAAEEDTGDR